MRSIPKRARMKARKQGADEPTARKREQGKCNQATKAVVVTFTA